MTESMSSEYEARANQLRSQMGVTMDELRSNLTPSHLASEAADRVGIADWSWSSALGAASKRHPLPTAIIGAGLALWTLAAMRKRSRNYGVGALPFGESSASFVDSATRSLRQQADVKKREFVDVAQAHVATGVEKLTDEIDKRLGNVVNRIPGGIDARPLVGAAVQIALAAVVNRFLQRRNA